MNVRRVLKKIFSSPPPFLKPSPFTGCLLTPEEPWSSAQLNAPRVDREHANSKMRPALFFFLSSSSSSFFAVATHNTARERDLYTFASTLITRRTWSARTHTHASNLNTAAHKRTRARFQRGVFTKWSSADVHISNAIRIHPDGQEKYMKKKDPTGGRRTRERCLCNQTDSVHTSHLLPPVINQQNSCWRTLKVGRTRLDPKGCDLVRKAISVASVATCAYARINFLKSIAMK